MEDFFRMLRDELELTYEYVGCCIVEYPRWLSRVLRAVGLRGDGEMGDIRGAKGDFRARLGRVAGMALPVEMLKDNLGLEAREASMLTGCGVFVAGR